MTTQNRQESNAKKQKNKKTKKTPSDGYTGSSSTLSNHIQNDSTQCFVCEGPVNGFKYECTWYKQIGCIITIELESVIDL